MEKEQYPVNKNSPWYHGSPLELSELALGSTITQWKELAEAFSHKPNCLGYNTIFGNIQHDGTLPGFLYIIDEPVEIGTDIYSHPCSSMDDGVEWLTTRPLKLKLLGELNYP